VATIFDDQVLRVRGRQYLLCFPWCIQDVSLHLRSAAEHTPIGDTPYADAGFQWLFRIAVIVTVPKTPACVKGSFFEKVSAASRFGTFTM
jgi:hypothetical protein